MNRSKTSPDLKVTRSVLSPSISSDGTDLAKSPQQRIPSTQEIVFYVCVEAVKELRDYWKTIVETFIKHSSTVVEVCIGKMI